jgi:phosphoribosylamine--glycine ligase
MKRIAFAGTDGRSLLSALEVSKAESDLYPGEFRGAVIRGMTSMPRFAEILDWPVDFIPTESKSVEHYAAAIIDALRNGDIDYVVPMPEDLLFEGLVDVIEEAGFGDRICGLTQEGSMLVEGDKIKCKELCRHAGIPVADAWTVIDARDFYKFRGVCLAYLNKHNGVVAKYPRSAGGKGARIIRDAWQIWPVYKKLIEDYGKNYEKIYGKDQPWPLLIESLMAGVEISFTIPVDGKGNYQILPTAMDYPERYDPEERGPASKDNPITGGMCSISPHPMETPELIEMAGRVIAEPLIAALKKKGELRPCILYPGCFISFYADKRPGRIRVSEVNIRLGEPEMQPVARRLRNLGSLIQAMLEGNLDKVKPEVRENQISISVALVTGPGGPDEQKGYPYSYTKGEKVWIDWDNIPKRILLIPSGMSWNEDKGHLVSDGTRVIYIIGNRGIKPGQKMGEVANKLRAALLDTAKNKIRVIPVEDEDGNRLVWRGDVGSQFENADSLFSNEVDFRELYEAE